MFDYTPEAEAYTKKQLYPSMEKRKKQVKIVVISTYLNDCMDGTTKAPNDSFISKYFKISPIRIK